MGLKNHGQSFGVALGMDSELSERLEEGDVCVAVKPQRSQPAHSLYRNICDVFQIQNQWITVNQNESDKGNSVIWSLLEGKELGYLVAAAV